MTLRLDPARAVLNYRNNPTKENGDVLRESLLPVNVYVPLPPQTVSDASTFDISKFSFLHLEYDGGRAIVCFTGENRIPESMRSFPFVLISFDLFYNKVMQELENIDGVGINPGLDLQGCFIPADHFPMIFQDIPSQSEILEQGRIMRFNTALNQLSEEQKENIREIVREYPTIDHLWIAADCTDPGETRWMLVYDGVEISDEDLVTLCRLFLKEAGGPMSAGVLHANSQAASGIVQEFEPLFVRSFAA